MSRALALLAALAVLAGASSEAAAQRGRRAANKQVSRFQEPAEERSLEAEEEPAII